MVAKILLIDDVEDVREILDDALSSAGHDVTPIGLGSEGITILKGDEIFDIVITDILMPDSDGLEVILAAMEREPRPKIIAISGGGAMVPASITLGGAKLMADATLQKPFDEAKLLNTVQMVLA